MNKKNTKYDGKSTKKSTGRSEKLLLIAILSIGILGLTFSYSKKRSANPTMTSSSHDTTQAKQEQQINNPIYKPQNTAKTTSSVKKL